VTEFVRVESLAGAPCRLRTDLVRPLAVAAERPVTLTESDGTVLLDLRAGESAVIYPAARTPDLSIAAVLGDGCTGFFADRRCRAP
jgi:alpha-L-fucosidase 2